MSQRIDRETPVSFPNGSYKKKYRLKKSQTNRHCESVSNPTVQSDAKNDVGSPIPSTQNVIYSKEYEEENQR